MLLFTMNNYFLRTIQAILSILFTLFLCYIDEGNYNLELMLDLDWGDWIFFFVYCSIFYFLLKFTFKRLLNRKK